MKMLLIAYEFPPSRSPQSLRWMYFTRELVAQGVEVHVLSPETRAAHGCPDVPDGVVVHRTSPGPISGAVNWIARWHQRRRSAVIGQPLELAAEERQPASRAQVTLNWKGRLLESAQNIAGKLFFPDSRGEWRPHAKRALARLLVSLRPDVVISSHEPATTLELGRVAKQRGFHWVVDLGDPVLSFYTPRRWRKRSFVVERQACREADHVIVTTERARSLLVQRHGGPAGKFTVLTQGFDALARRDARALEIEWNTDGLELLYTGSFYEFRGPRALVDAVLASGGVRLSIATSRAPPWLVDIADRYPDSIRLLGFLSHEMALAAQRHAHVLVNLGNTDSTHVPGKLYEYLGAGTPILHIGHVNQDAAADLVRRIGGVVCENDMTAIRRALESLQAARLAGGSEPVVEGIVDAYSWQRVGIELGAVLRRVVG